MSACLGLIVSLSFDVGFLGRGFRTRLIAYQGHVNPMRHDKLHCDIPCCEAQIIHLETFSPLFRQLFDFYQSGLVSMCFYGLLG